MGNICDHWEEYDSSFLVGLVLSEKYLMGDLFTSYTLCAPSGTKLWGLASRANAERPGREGRRPPLKAHSDAWQEVESGGGCPPV